MRDVQTQRLDRRANRDVAADVNIIVLRKQLTSLFQLIQFVVGFSHLVRRILRQCIHHRLRTCLRHILVNQAGYRVADIVQQVHCTGVDVQHEVQPVFLIAMNHFCLFPPIYRNKARRTARLFTPSARFARCSIETGCVAAIFIKTRGLCVGFYTGNEKSFACRNFFRPALCPGGMPGTSSPIETAVSIEAK